MMSISIDVDSDSSSDEEEEDPAPVKKHKGQLSTLYVGCVLHCNPVSLLSSLNSN